MVEFSISSKTITFYDSQDNTYIIHREHLNFAKIRALLIEETSNEQELIHLASLSEAIRSTFDNVELNYLPKGKLTIDRYNVYYDGDPIDSTVTRKLLSIVEKGEDVVPWKLFVENLYTNPNDSTRSELYDWMRGTDLPITTDGHFLAFKKVTSNFKDYHTQTFDNSIGKIVSMKKRADVDPVRSNLCSRGLHFCSYNYLNHFYSSEGRIVIVKINPADVVSIPLDYNFTKGRCWKYQVLAEISTDAARSKRWPAVSNLTHPVKTLIE